MTRISKFSRRLLAVGTAVGLGLTLLPPVPASATTARVPSYFFGMHDGDPVTWPKAPVGAVRLWDAGVNWRQIETSKGVYDFSRLDAEVDAARSHGATVLVVLGQTPRFHSTTPNKRGSYGLGAAGMPTQTAWKNYVYQVVHRYRGRGVDYQVWNEANVSGYWQGTASQMATLTKLTSQVVNNNDKSAKVVAPALATRLTSQRKWLRTFYGTKVGGKKVASYIDAVSLNLYPAANASPEASMTLLSAAKTMLHQAGVSKPIWNTEINYGLLGGGTAKHIARTKQAAYVGRTYLLNAAAGIKRVYWYAWDIQSLANTQLTFGNGTSVTSAGVAYETVRGWLLNSRVKSCTHDSRGTYTCTLLYSGGVRRVYWNPSRTVTVSTVKSAHAVYTLQGAQRTIKGGAKVKVSKTPVMVRSSK